MAHPLPLRPSPIARETFHSFLSRLAAMNGDSTTEFCSNMGISFKRAVDLQDDAVERVGQLGGLAPDDLATMMSWTGQRVGDVRMRFRGEIFVSRALRNPIVRGCPVCLRVDAKAHAGDPIEAMALRGDWQLREVSLCLRHGRLLVPLWEVTQVDRRQDTGARLTEIVDRVLRGELDGASAEASPYDLWLDRRLEDGTDTTHLASHSLYAASIFCRLLGMELLRTDKHEAEREGNELRAAQAAGFEVARQGRTAIRSALDQLAAQTEGSQLDFRRVFGNLYTKLRYEYKNDRSFDPFRRILRECILEIWPIQPEQNFLGEDLKERHLHSLYTASIETGIDIGTLRRILYEAGAISPEDDRPDNRKTFNARVFAPLLTEIPSLVGITAMCEAIGATRGEFLAMIKDGVLSPRIRADKVINVWRVADGLELLAELQARAIGVESGVPGWETLQTVRNRTMTSLDILLTAIRAGHVQLGRLVGVNGYHGLVVRSDDIAKLGYNRKRSSRQPSPANLTSAAEFGRSIGIRDGGRFLALVEAGHISSVLNLHPVTGRPQRLMSDADIADFHRRFMTKNTIGAATGLHWNTIRMRLAAGCVRPFSPDGWNFGPIYLRAEVEPLFHDELRSVRL